MPFEDKALECRDCHQSFVFSAGEQEFYQNRGLVNQPNRCSNCRIAKRMIKEGRSLTNLSEVNCHDCGILTSVPFKPTGIRPVFCQTCFQKQKANAEKR